MFLSPSVFYPRNRLWLQVVIFILISEADKDFVSDGKLFFSSPRSGMEWSAPPPLHLASLLPSSIASFVFFCSVIFFVVVAFVCLFISVCHIFHGLFFPDFFSLSRLLFLCFSCMSYMFIFVCFVCLLVFISFVFCFVYFFVSCLFRFFFLYIYIV